MIDIKTKLVLKILTKECSDGNYKVIEIPDIISSLPKRYRMDDNAIKHILTHLERQDMISIKYDDDDIYCLTVLPFGFETAEQESPKTQRKDIRPAKNISYQTVIFSFLSALLGSTLGITIAYFLLKIIQ